MSLAEPENSMAKAPHRVSRWPLFSASVVLLLIAWLIAQYPPISTESVSLMLLVTGAAPWFLQWAGVTCAILACCGSRSTMGAFVFAILVSLTFATIWWCGLAFYFRGMDPFDAILHAATLDMKLQLGVASTFGEILFNFIGPILGPLQLCGPISLDGWDSPLAVLSTSLLVGYLLIVGRVCRVGIRSQRSQGNEAIRFLAAMLPCFLPPFIRFVVQIVHTTGLFAD